MQSPARRLEPDDAGGQHAVDTGVGPQCLLDGALRLVQLRPVDMQGLHGAAAHAQLLGESGTAVDERRIPLFVDDAQRLPHPGRRHCGASFLPGLEVNLTDVGQRTDAAVHTLADIDHHDRGTGR